MNEIQGTSSPLPPPSGTPQGPTVPAPAPPYSPTPPAPAEAAAQQSLIASLAAAAPWVRFVAILGFIQVGITGLVGLVFLVISLPGSEGPVGRLMGLVYLVIAGVYLIPLLPLYRFGSEASRLKSTPSLAIAAGALGHHRTFWKTVGIFCIIALALIPVAIVAVLISGFMLAAMR